MRPEYREEPCRSALNRVKGMMFGWSLNPYMGCAHQCTFCYVRAFEKRADRPSGDRYGASIRIKTNVVEVLRRELARRSWKGELVAIGAATDPYQPAEGRYRLTRGCIETLGEARNPFAIITRGPMIVRDVDVLAEAARWAKVSVTFSVPTLDPEIWRTTEPNTPPPAQRLRALRVLHDAGIEAGVGMAPILPGLSDKPELMADVVRAARDAGAAFVWTNVLYLRPGTREHFLEHLARDWPEQLPRYERLYRGRAYLSKGEIEPVRREVSELRDRFGIGERDHRGRSGPAPGDRRAPAAARQPARLPLRAAGGSQARPARRDAGVNRPVQLSLEGLVEPPAAIHGARGKPKEVDRRPGGVIPALRPSRVAGTIVALALLAGACAVPPSTPSPTPTVEAPVAAAFIVGCTSIEAPECASVARVVAGGLPVGRGTPFSIQITLFDCANVGCPRSLAAREGQATVEYADGGEPIQLRLLGPPDAPRIAAQQGAWSGLIQPGSPRVIGHGPFPFELGHCGLGHVVDFDGSFWLPVGQIDGDAAPLINSDRGQIALVEPNLAEFRGSGGFVARLARFPGPKQFWLCA